MEQSRLGSMNTVDFIFARLTARYGDDWTRKWEGIDAASIKADWAHVLAGVHVNAIVYALEYLPPDRPPTSAAFRDVCRRAPAPEAPRLEAPKADPARVARELRRLMTLRERERPTPAQAAEVLMNREQRGERLTEFQRQFWRDVLREHEVDPSNGLVSYTPIRNDALPPAMRGQTHADKA